MGKRFETTFTINQPNEFVQFILNDFFAKEGITLTDVCWILNFAATMASL